MRSFSGEPLELEFSSETSLSPETNCVLLRSGILVLPMVSSLRRTGLSPYHLPVSVTAPEKESPKISYL